MPSRRTLLKSLAVGPAVLATAGLASTHVSGSAPEAVKRGVKGWHYRYALGAVEVHVLSDGVLAFPPHPTFGGDQVPEEEVLNVLKSNYRPLDSIRAQLNVALVDTGKLRILVDTGYGERGREGTGALLASLELAGYAPGDIDMILISHAHPDHLFGCTRTDGEPIFPRAKILISKEEKAAWTRNEEELAQLEADGDRLAGLYRSINTIFAQAEDRMVTVSMDNKLAEGVKLLPLPGHTPGHVGIHLGSRDEELMLLADAANHEILMTEKPDWPFGFDVDPVQTAETRRDLFGKLADQRIPCLGYHWAWPGVAHIGRDGDHFRWHPVPMRRS